MLRIGQADEAIPEYFTGMSAQMPYPRHTRLISIWIASITTSFQSLARFPKASSYSTMLKKVPADKIRRIKLEKINR